MYDFNVKVKVQALFEITYEDVVMESDQREGAYVRKVVKSERFGDFDDLRSFAYGLKAKKILQVVEVRDLTSRLQNEMRTQGKD
jgi:hypothetical protein